MFRKIAKKLKGDKADSSLISLVIMIPLLVGLMITMIDTAIYFADRAQIQSIAKSGSHTVAIMGGNGNESLSTAIEAKYGLTKAETCSKVKTGGIASAAKTAKSTAIECNMILGVNDTVGLVNVNVNSVKCNPPKTGAVGARTTCEIKWIYGGIPGSALSFLRSSPIAGTGSVLAKEQITAASSESEVDLTNTYFVERR
jgi:hypothetical protein